MKEKNKISLNIRELTRRTQQQTERQQMAHNPRKGSVAAILKRRSRRRSLKQGPPSTSSGTGQYEARMVVKRSQLGKAVDSPPSTVSKKWKFRLWAKIAIILRGTCEECITKGRRADHNPFCVQIESCDAADSTVQSNSAQVDKLRYIFFNPAHFKANTQMRMSHEVKQILTKPPEKRTEDEIHHAMIALRGLKLVAEYPVRMQRNLAQYGYFSSYGPRRFVIKENRRPEGFYFIIYGKVLVAVLQGSGYAKTVVELTAEHSFGELAIINGTRRQSSVITKTYTEILGISDEVYAKIFMVGGAKSINDPDQERFLRSLNFLRGWPIELFEKYDPKNFTFSYFRRNTVIVRNSNFSDWIFIVKSGSITVLKKLIKVRHTRTKFAGRPQKAFSDRLLAFQNNELGRDSWIFDMSQADVSCTLTSDDSDDDDDDKYDEASYERKLRNRPHTCYSSPRVLPGPGRNRRPNVRLTQSVADNVKKTQSQQFENKLEVVGTSWSDLPHLRSSYITAQSSLTEGDSSKNIRTHIDDINPACNIKECFEAEADMDPQFVNVQSLTKGDAFGLRQILFDRQPSMSLVSNGSECMLLNKKFFLDNCPQDLLRRLKREVLPYPSDTALQQELKTKVNWEMYKLTLRKEMMPSLPRRCHSLIESASQQQNVDRSKSDSYVRSSQSTLAGY
ncbi:uncharacterized protein LOC121369190 [Gigantopelta aegis]|uniref:uncharacterized protein LOC121369190 n=1 Tax=Gigantopelta aegis TaxID=1735272 RepID=UPI001B88B966|nr:uncharacterized protein LOC121369190 [Gigantopelta aegis]